MACAAVLEPNRDFPAWLEAQGVNAEVARAMDSELGIRDYGVLRACVGDGLVRAELLATARDRLPFGFYAVLRQVVKALQGAEPRDGGAAPRWDDAAVSSPGDVTLGGLVDVLLALFSGLSRELLLSARRLGAIDGQGNGGGGSSVEDSAMEQHLNCTENEEIRDVATSIIDHDQNKMMHIIKMEEHDDVDGGEGGLVDENDDGCEWRLQDGAESMAAACIDGPGKSEENHSGFIIDDVTSLQGTAQHLLKCGRPDSAIGLASSQVPLGKVHDPEWTPLGPPYEGRPSTVQRSGGPGGRGEPLAKHTGAATVSGDQYSCKVCGQQFSRASYLRKHTLTHTTERPHRCPVCGRAFKRPCELTRHRRTHTGERPHGCVICGRTFTRCQQLKIHLRTHTGEKPYHCGECGQLFSHHHSFKRHQRTHAGRKAEKERRCANQGDGLTQLGKGAREGTDADLNVN